VARPVYERDGFPGEEIGGVRGLLGDGEALPVDIEAVGVVARSRERDPAVPPGRDVGAAVTVQVLADQGRLVAGVVEPRGDRRGIPKIVESAHESAVLVHPGRVRVGAAQDARPARAAERIRHEAVREGDAASHELLADDGHVGERVPALVVGEDEDDVRLSRGGRRGERERRESQYDEAADSGEHGMTIRPQPVGFNGRGYDGFVAHPATSTIALSGRKASPGFVVSRACTSGTGAPCVRASLAFRAPERRRRHRESH
jgi:hypothetical protein